MHRYRVHRRLGRGSGGEALLAEDTHGHCVLKCVQLAGLTRRRRQRALHEVHVLRTLAHPNVLRIHRAFLHEQHLVVASEFCDAGDLEELVNRRRSLVAPSHSLGAAACSPGFSETSVLGVFVQVACGVQYIHKQGIVHRDLKASNILLTQRGVAKVGDFGIAFSHNLDITATAGEGPALDNLLGSMHHIPPEVCDGGQYTELGDCWALGIILYEMCTLSLPFQGSNSLAVALRIIEGSFRPLPPSYSCELRKLCSSLLCTDLHQRLAVGEVLSLPFIRRIQKRPDAFDMLLGPAPGSPDEALLQLRTMQPLVHALGPLEYERFMMKQIETREGGAAHDAYNAQDMSAGG